METLMRKKSVHKYPASRRKTPEQVPATDFKNTCLQLLDRVEQTREEIVVTKHGRPVAKLVAFDEARPRLFGHLAGSITVHGDITAPIGETWDAEG
jgi:prevent-host-death family protein